ncbi:MAG: hypothetical protein IMX00_10160 [Limnochordales bacterium]|nr:hypothetical protein [Limnochordales bacterium]
MAVVTVAAGGLLARGATEAFLARLVEGYLGEENSFDLLVQIHTADAEAGRQALAELLARELPGTRIKVGPALGGQQNYFLTIPAERKTARDLGRLDALLARLSGFSGYTVLMHPVVTVSRVHPAFRPQIQEAASSLSGVKLWFWHGDDLVLLLENPEESAQVSSRLQRLLQRSQVYRLELPVPLAAGELSRLADGVAARLNAGEGGEGTARYQPVPLNGTRSSGGLNGSWGAGDLEQALRAARQVLQLYVTRVELRFPEATNLRSGDRILLVPADLAGEGADAGSQVAAVVAQVTEVASDGTDGQALVVKGQWNGGEAARVFAMKDDRVGAEIGSATIDSPRLKLIAALNRAEQLLTSAQSSGQELPQVLDELEAALRGVEKLLDRVDILFQNSPVEEKDQLLLTLALRVLTEELGLTGGENGERAGTALGEDMAGLDRERLMRLRKGIERLQQQSALADPSQLAPLLVDLKGLSGSLRDLNDGQLGASLLSLEQYLQASTAAGSHLEWRGPAGLAEERLREAVAAELAEAAETLPASARITSLPAGIIQPDARTQLLTVVRSAGRLVNFLSVAVLTLLVLLFDQATVIAAWKVVRRAKQRHVRANRSWERVLVGLRGACERLAPAIYGVCTGALLAGGGSFVGLVLNAAGGRGGDVTTPAGLAQGTAGAFADLGACQLPLIVGALLGLLVALAAERLSPVPEEQIWAGESLGLSYRQILEEIVIPTGRPGLYQLLLAVSRTLFTRARRDRGVRSQAVKRRPGGLYGGTSRGRGPTGDGGTGRERNVEGEGKAWQVSW